MGWLDAGRGLLICFFFADSSVMGARVMLGLGAATTGARVGPYMNACWVANMPLRYRLVFSLFNQRWLCGHSAR